MRRLRRLRKNKVLRDLVSEVQLSANDLIMPYFIAEGKKLKQPIASMPGLYHLSIDDLIKDIAEAKKIQSVLLFGIPKIKNSIGSSAYKSTGVIQQTIKMVKKEFPQIVVITDVCLCGYMSHGHCGVVTSYESGATNHKYVDNDATLGILTKIACSHANAGADFVAPSAMMDGQVQAIRKALDEESLKNTGILAYSAKYASVFYEPFREALGSSPQFGDRKNYQMDFRNSNEALREIKQDIDEGADIIMVKPALAYLDVIHRAKEKFNIPLAAYSVSGEYSMIKAYCHTIKNKKQRAEVENKLILETLTAIKRAGADIIITYYAKEVAKWLFI